MSHFAKLDENNVVIFVTVGRGEDDGKETELSARTGDRYVQTSYNGSFRAHYAGIGYTYDETNDVFYPPQPFPSWVLDENWNWQAPHPAPDDGEEYGWDEETGGWVQL